MAAPATTAPAMPATVTPATSAPTTAAASGAAARGVRQGNRVVGRVSVEVRAARRPERVPRQEPALRGLIEPRPHEIQPAALRHHPPLAVVREGIAPRAGRALDLAEREVMVRIDV